MLRLHLEPQPLEMPLPPNLGPGKLLYKVDLRWVEPASVLFQLHDPGQCLFCLFQLEAAVLVGLCGGASVRRLMDYLRFRAFH